MTNRRTKITFKGPALLKANQLFTYSVRITMGQAVMPGGKVVLAVRHASDLGDPQMGHPRAENYVSVKTTTRGTRWRLGPVNDWKRHPWNLGIELQLVKGRLKPGDEIMIVLGDRSRGSPGYRAQSFVETAFRFRLGIDARGDGKWKVLPENACPGLRVTGNRTACIRAFVPRSTDYSGKICVHLKPEDQYGNVAGKVPGEVSLLLDDRCPAGRARLSPGKATKHILTVPDDKKWHWVTVATDDGALLSRSNPFGPSPLKGYKLYWGEIHAQSELCDGTNTPAGLYRYARDVAGLDFASVTSHDFLLTAGDWKEIQAATRQAHVPHRFVTFLGYEWSGRPGLGGDNNIYFLDDEGPLVYSAPYGAYPEWDTAQGAVRYSKDLAQVIRELGKRRVMIVPHCGGRCCNLDFYDPDVMPLFEIHSCHRTYAHMVRESIRRGIRFGFIGGSDDHRGAIGDSHLSARDRFLSSHSGLVAVYARELTRESLWEAFFARRVYATNGPRIVLDVRIDGHPMGSELRVASGKSLKLFFFVRLDGLLDRVEVMRDKSLIHTLEPLANKTFEFKSELDIVATGEPHCYHLKVYQADGGWAWSSPIWVIPDLVSKKRYKGNKPKHFTRNMQ